MSVAVPTAQIHYRVPEHLAAAVCVNDRCSTRGRGGPAFVTEETEEGETCIECGCRQSNGGKLMNDGSSGFREQEMDEQRRIEAAANLQKSFGNKRKAETLQHEAKIRKHERNYVKQELEAANARVRHEAASKAAHLHPSNVAGVPTTKDIKQLQAHVEATLQDLEQQLKQESDPYLQAREALQAVMSVTREHPGNWAFLLAPSDSASSGKQLGTPALLYADVRHRLQWHLSQERGKKTAVQKVYREEVKKQLETTTTPVASLDGEQVWLHKKAIDVARKNNSSILDRKEEEDVDPEVALLNRVRLAKMNYSAIESRVEALFVFVYDGVIWELISGAQSRDYKENPAYVRWYNRTLDFVIQWKHHLSPKQLRKVELYAMHALILASWEGPCPLNWGLMQPVLLNHLGLLRDESYQARKESVVNHYNADIQKALQEERPLSTVISLKDRLDLLPLGADPTLPKLGKLNSTLLEMARVFNIKANCCALVESFARSYIDQLRQTSFNTELTAQLDICRREYVRRLRLAGPYFDALAAQIGVAVSPSPDAAAAAIASSSTTTTILSFSAAVIAATCVRKVLGDKQIPYDSWQAQNNCVTVKQTKPSYAQARSRPLLTVNGQPGMVFKAQRFAEIAGVHSKDITACGHMFETAIYGKHYAQAGPRRGSPYSSVIRDRPFEDEDDALPAAAAATAASSAPAEPTAWED